MPTSDWEHGRSTYGEYGRRTYGKHCRATIIQTLNHTSADVRFLVFRAGDIVELKATFSEGVHLCQDEAKARMDAIVEGWQREFPSLPIWPEIAEEAHDA